MYTKYPTVYNVDILLPEPNSELCLTFLTVGHSHILHPGQSRHLLQLQLIKTELSES